MVRGAELGVRSWGHETPNFEPGTSHIEPHRAYSTALVSRITVTLI
jgi:hypothetical protein